MVEEEHDTRMSLKDLFDDELEAGEEQSIENLFNEAFENVEEAMRRTDRMQKPGVSPLTPIW